MNSFFAKLLLFVLLGVSSALAVPPVYENGKLQPSSNAKVILSADRTDYILGENVQIEYQLENTGKEPFKAYFGGDNRGCDRALRFVVIAKDDKGITSAEPDPNPACFGGLGSTGEITSDKPSSWALAVMRYCVIEHAGTYTITVRHDLGWLNGTETAPAGTISLHFRMPSPEEAETLIEKMEKLPDVPSRGYLFGEEKPQDFADFRCFRYPVYLEPLLQRAKAGDARALEGVGTIPTQEATAALIDLTSVSDSKLSLDAAHTLSLRLPDPEFTGELPTRGPWNIYVSDRRKALAKQSWDPKFNDAVRALALKFMARPDPDGVSAGGFMFQAVGTPADAAGLFQALDVSLEPTTQPRHSQTVDVLDFPTTVTELMRAAQILYLRGYDDKNQPSTEGQLFTYFEHWKNPKPDRPDDFLKLATAGIADSHYPVRQAVVEALPQPLPDAYVPILKTALADPDYGVMRVACETAGKSGRAEFLPPVLQIVRKENEEWLMRSSMGAALQLNGSVEALNAIADHLTDAKLTDVALDSLQTVIADHLGGWSGNSNLTTAEREALRGTWKAFLTKNADALRAGTKFKIGDPALSTDLFGRTRSFDLPNGGHWPKPQK